MTMNKATLSAIVLNFTSEMRSLLTLHPEMRSYSLYIRNAIALNSISKNAIAPNSVPEMRSLFTLHQKYIFT